MRPRQKPAPVKRENVFLTALFVLVVTAAFITGLMLWVDHRVHLMHRM